MKLISTRQIYNSLQREITVCSVTLYRTYNKTFSVVFITCEYTLFLYLNSVTIHENLHKNMIKPDSIACKNAKYAIANSGVAPY